MNNPRREAKRNIFLDRRLEEYEPFWDDDFGEQLREASAHDEQLDLLALDLELNWRSCAYAAGTPFIFVSALEQYGTQLATAIEPGDSALTFSVSILTRLRNRVPEITRDPKLAQVIKTELLRISAEVLAAKRTARERVGAGFTRTQAWEEFIGVGAFQISARAAVQLGYIGVWSAYEEFLVHVVKLSLGRKKLRASSDQFPAALDEAFGDGASQQYWTNSGLALYREVRNSLVHAGGRLVGGIESHKQEVRRTFNVEGERIDVFPQNTRNMYLALRSCVLGVCRSFRTPGDVL